MQVHRFYGVAISLGYIVTIAKLGFLLNFQKRNRLCLFENTEFYFFVQYFFIQYTLFTVSFFIHSYEHLQGRKRACAINHIITNSYLFISFIFKFIVDSTEAKEEFTYKRNYSFSSVETFKQKLVETNWNGIKKSYLPSSKNPERRVQKGI